MAAGKIGVAMATRSEREREKTTAMFGFDLMEDLPSRCRESMFLGWKED